MTDVAGLSPKELLRLHAAVSEELRFRDILRSTNKPTGELAEYLFCTAFGWARRNSNANIDAVSPDNFRYHMKGSRMTRYNNSRQLSAISDFQGQHFDFLAVVLFTEHYDDHRAAPGTWLGDYIYSTVPNPW